MNLQTDGHMHEIPTSNCYECSVRGECLDGHQVAAGRRKG
jgi:hypothetical protein